MACNKRPFESPAQATKALRVWQRRARRSAFDLGHVYHCPECTPGTFHIGRDHGQESKPGKVLGSRNKPLRAYVEPDDLADIFEAQVKRVRGHLKTAMVRTAREYKRLAEDQLGPVAKPQGTFSAGDTFDVESR